MNILSDFSIRVEEAVGNKSSDINYLQSTVKKQAKQIIKYKTDLKQLKQKNPHLANTKTVKSKTKTSRVNKPATKKEQKGKK